jgi:hypothetical protein
MTMRLASVGLVACLLLLRLAPAGAATPAAVTCPAALIQLGPACMRPPLTLYEARVIVTGTDMRSRPWGFAQCLADVLVKVSGDPALAHDARVASLAAHADTLVTGFDYWDRMSGIPHHDDQGSSDRPYNLTVRFDPAKIAAALAELGSSPWRGERPALVPVVFVTAPAAAFLLTTDATAGTDQRAALADAGERYFMPLAVPALADLARPVAGLPLPGTLTWSDAAHGWVAAWHLAWQGHSYAWGIQGVSFDEAFRDGVRGAMGIVSGHPPAE